MKGIEPVSQALHIAAEPIGPQCNLNCTYCFYLEKQALFAKGQSCKVGLVGHS